MKDKKRKSHFFYARKNEKEKCSWLSRLQSATTKKRQNIVAYNCSKGVCFEAVKDITSGEELMALFDESFKGIIAEFNFQSSHSLFLAIEKIS